LERIIPKEGVYITKTTHNDLDYRSVTNIGTNPTFDDERRVTVETHIFDFDADIYGEKITVDFFRRIRDELKFSSVRELVAQITKDTQTARDYFKK
jgi:riboflavin kinase/FMN adenylyltransferase